MVHFVFAAYVNRDTQGAACISRRLRARLPEAMAHVKSEFACINSTTACWRYMQASNRKNAPLKRAWTEEIILTLSGQFKQLSLMCTWKIQVTPTGFEPTTSATPVQCSYQLSYEATQLRAGQFVGLMRVFPRKEWWMKEMIMKCGLDMNWRNDPHTFWTI